MDVDLDYENKALKVKQEIVFHNQSNDTLREFILNDWNNAYSDKNSPLGRRFSDEFIRSFHLEKDENRGKTTVYSVTGESGLFNWKRVPEQPDLIDIELKKPIYPNEKFTVNIAYDVKIPEDKFTRYGYDNKGNINLKDWYLVPARVENGKFVKYSNENIDDIANSAGTFEVHFTADSDLKITTDLYQGNKTVTENKTKYYFIGENRLGFSFIIEKENSFEIYSNHLAEVNTNIEDDRVTDIQKAFLIDKIMRFTNANLSSYPHGKIVVSQIDYERNPVYGLNQLPAFIAPFPDSFLYEIKFLKTYLNNYLKTTLRINPRKDNWIYDGIQVYLMQKYVEENHPDKTMMGLKWGILKGHNLFKVDYNSQYEYLYLLMARKNLDQPIGASKETFIKFNEQIAGKYKAGRSLNYLDSYLGKNIVPQSIAEFYELNQTQQTNRNDFKNIINKKTEKDVEWFFENLIDSRKLIDFKLGKVGTKGDSLKVTVKNKTGTNVPVSLYGFSNDTLTGQQKRP